MRQGIDTVVTALILFTFVFQTLQAQPPAPAEVHGIFQLKTIATLPKSIREASGLEMSSSGLLWTHNDDRIPILYGIDTLGNVKRVVHLNHTNRGWEDLTTDDAGSVYIGAIGNNNNDRKNLSILKIPAPENITDKIVNADMIHYEYEDQSQFPPPEPQWNFDADALVNIGDSLYIITKNRTVPFTGYARVYRLPTTPGRYQAVLHDSIYLGTGSMMQHWVTSADLSPDGKWLALLSHDCIWVITDFPQTRFSAGRLFRIDLQNFSHKAGLCFSSPTKIYIVDELEFGFLGGKLYSLDMGDLPKVIKKAVK